jgi:hypothetical protein
MHPEYLHTFTHTQTWWLVAITALPAAASVLKVSQTHTLYALYACIHTHTHVHTCTCVCKAIQNIYMHTHTQTWWMVAMTVLPAAASVLKVSQTLYAVYVSSPEVGSSRNNIDGSVISSIATAVRLRSPPDIPPFSPAIPTIVSAHL